MKKIISAAVITLVIVLLGVGLFYYLDDFSFSSRDPLESIPSDAIAVLCIENNANSLNEIKDHEFWSYFRVSEYISGIHNDLAAFSELLSTIGAEIFKERIYASLHITGSGSFDLLYSTKISADITDQQLIYFFGEIDTANTLSFTTREYEASKVYEFKFANGRTFAATISQGIFLGSFTSFLVDDGLRKLAIKVPQKNAEDFSKYLEDGNSIVVFPSYLSRLISVFEAPDKKLPFPLLNNLSGPVFAGFEIRSDALKLAGSVETGSRKDFIDCFKGQGPVASQATNILPANTAFYIAYNINSPKKFAANLSSYIKSEFSDATYDQIRSAKDLYNVDLEKQIYSWLGGQIIMSIVEPPGTRYTNNVVGMIQTINVEKAQDSLAELIKLIDNKLGSKTPTESYKGHRIRLIKLPGLMRLAYGPIFDNLNDTYYTFINDYMVFANRPSMLRNVIDYYEKGSVLSKSKTYKKLTENLSSLSNIVVYSDFTRSQNILANISSPKWDISKYAGSGSKFVGAASQFIIVDSTRADFEASFCFGQERGKSSNLLYATELDAPVSGNPKVFKDPAKRGYQILVQDIENTLYLIDENGNIKWKNQVGEKIISEIYQIDLFRNNVNQFIFNTKTYMHVLDLNGRPMGNYPIRLPAQAAASLSIFKNNTGTQFNIYVPCTNNRVYAYQLDGRPLPGWNYSSVSGELYKKIDIIDIKQQSRLVISDNGGSQTLANFLGEKILVSKGQIVEPDASIYSIEKYDPQMLWVSVSTSGNLIKCNASGTAELIPLSLKNDKFGFIYNDLDNDGINEFVITDGTEVQVYTYELASLFNVDLKTELTNSIQVLHSIKNETYIAIHSTDNQTWLLDREGKILNGFPVKGNRGCELIEGDSGQQSLLVIGDKDGVIYTYSLE